MANNRALANTTKRALVIGAGLAGAAMSHALQGCGFDVDLIEDRPLFDAADGAGIMLSPNGVAMLHKLGFQSITKQHGQRLNSLHFGDPSGKVHSQLDCSNFYYQPLGIRHATLRGSLLEGLKVRHGESVQRIYNVDTPDVELTGGARRTYDLVVGADGVHSKTREFLFGKQIPERFEAYSGYRFVVDDTLELKTATTLLGNGLTLLFVPLGHGQTYCGAGPIHSHVLQQRESPIDTIAQTYASFPLAASVLQHCHSETRFIRSRFWQVNLPRWTAGSVVLIGDAAHAAAPTLAQGTAMALEDVAVLTQELKQSDQISTALQRFEARRRQRVAFVQRESARRMHANVPTSTKRDRLRRFSSRAFGTRDLHTHWTRLTKQDPLRDWS